jgi:hypothetical protein
LYSIEWRAAARSVLLVGADPDQPKKRAITQTKNNLGPLAESLGYVIEPELESPSGARFAWTGASDLTAERILAPLNREGEDEATERRDGVDFLREMLKGGEIEAKEIEKSRKAAGISDYSLRKAKAFLRIKTRERGGTFSGEQSWVWSLPEAEDYDEGVEGVDQKELHRLQVNDRYNSSYSNALTEGVEVTINQHLQQPRSAHSMPSVTPREVLTI